MGLGDSSEPQTKMLCPQEPQVAGQMKSSDAPQSTMWMGEEGTRTTEPCLLQTWVHFVVLNTHRKLLCLPKNFIETFGTLGSSFVFLLLIET